MQNENTSFFCDRTYSELMEEWNAQKEIPNTNKNYRILLTGDIHSTDLETWYGWPDEKRMQHFVDHVLAEHAIRPFDAILVLGDISLDYHDCKTPYNKGYSTGQDFLQRFFSQLPQDIPHFILAGNHEQFSYEDWLALTGNERQGTVVIGENTFVMLDNYAEDLGPVYDSSDKYSLIDTAYIKEQIEKYPHNRVFLCSHAFELENESEAFLQLLREESRIKGLFMGHSHLCGVIALGEEYQNLTIAQIGNFSYSDDENNRKDTFWGIRDLIIEGDRAVSRYILAESDAEVFGEQIHVEKREVDVCEYRL